MSGDRGAPMDAFPVPDTGGQETLREAFLLYRKAGLLLPPVPRELVDGLQELAPWRYGTVDSDLRDRDGFHAAAEDPAAPPQITFGHVGYGLASWWLCYRLIVGPLALFVRQSFGSAYDTDGQNTRRAINETVLDIEELIVAADAARDASRLAAGQRLIVAIDEVEGGGWGIAGAETFEWHASDRSVADVLAAFAPAPITP